MKALSLMEPWAALIAAGVKSIETRSWRTAYRGRCTSTPPGPRWTKRTPSRFAWVLEQVEPLEAPVAAKGHLSLWEWEPPP